MKLLSILFASALFSVSGQAAELTKVRIGWQIPWATQGQLVQVLKRTDILKKNGLEAEFVGRTFGPQLNEVAMGGGLDVVLTGDLPGLTLISKGKGWKGVGRLMYNRTLTYVPKNSPIKHLKGLKGKTIAMPIGAAAERVTKDALREAGLDPDKDVKIVNLDIREQGPIIMKSDGKETFEQFDALAGFDPLPAIFESQGKLKVLHTGKVVSMVLMNESFLKEQAGVGRKVMQSLLDAYDYYRQNQKEANEWFLAEAELKGATQEACALAASIEPNLKAKSKKKMTVAFSKDDLSHLKSAAAFLEGKTGAKVNVDESFTTEYALNLK